MSGVRVMGYGSRGRELQECAHRQRTTPDSRQMRRVDT
jgi:hypothetical protein